ncbi:MAG: septation protein IspZ [Planktomarina sp.]|jgi:intracellular septation protein|nr:septation protein IspZ [Planktomarina sp.]MDT2057710.1 inner membrane-spanning protein YciB [Planktomarina sp.]MDT2077750.1 inner membrane-spanning protein YciB [Planktomarina sp.]|tara:strand:- start:243 stop:842 length:600 start_codon:yes stop_codon:yes gene_type:complete
MSDDTLPKWVKPLLEFGPVIAFFVAYMRMKETVYTIAESDYQGFIVVTALFVPLLLICTAVLWKLTGKISPMQIMTVVLVTIFGGLTVWLNDDRFIKMKPTLIYMIFGGILGVGLLRGQSYLRVVMQEALPMQDAGWMILTRRATGFFFGLAVLNEVIWRSFSTDTWVYFKTFGLTVALFAFFMMQGTLLAKYAAHKDG